MGLCLLDRTRYRRVLSLEPYALASGTLSDSNPSPNQPEASAFGSAVRASHWDIFDRRPRALSIYGVDFHFSGLILDSRAEIPAPSCHWLPHRGRVA